MKSTEIRKKFFDFFVKNGHEKVPSSSLIPAQDPTLLFTNAGMNQFKDLFLGLEKRSYTRAVTIQKCVRAGGKHNDLDNVGFTKRHLTFFEMMGNFSFGDYFKKEAIQFAWDFITKEMKFPVEKLHATVYKDDLEAYELWHSLTGLPYDRIHKLGAADNFWQMGDTGPCGPCTEIYIDRGPQEGCGTKDCAPGCSCDRFLEFWNLVFMQYDRQPDGTDKPLKQTGVDTGMGLERLCAIAQNKDSVFETDLFANILHKIEELTGKIYAQQDQNTKAAFHVLADHIRSTTFLIADGCAPSNEGRGYVLRKIIRRAALFTQKLTDKNIFPSLSQVVVDDFGDIYPELKTNAALIQKVLDSEISKFSANLIRGNAILTQYFAENQNSKSINGAQAFKLYDTYGFPTELIEIMAREHGFTVDMAGFEKEMHKQKEQSGKKEHEEVTVDLDPEIKTEFTGYQELETSSEIIALVMDNKVVPFVPAGSSCFVIAKKAPFFIVGGGQVPDQGWLVIDKFRTPLLHVQYISNGIAAEIKAPVDLKIGMPVTSIVDKTWRTNAMKNHTATHMLQAALIQLLGNQVKQSGSLVHPDYLRFDFTYPENLSPELIKQVEDLVNEKIREDIKVNLEYMTMKEAVKRGALAFFGDKYNPEKVRMVEIPHFSVELCGGTHVPSTGVIGTFKITDVTALSAGHRRIFAVTGPKAIELFQQTFDTVKTLGQSYKVKREEVFDAVMHTKEQLQQAHHQLKQLKKQLWKAQLPVWEQQVTPINNIPLLFLIVDDMTNEELKEITQALMNKKPGFYFLVSNLGDKFLFMCTIAPELTSKIDLSTFALWLKNTHGLRGGGSKNVLQGGGTTLDKNLEETLKGWVQQL
ncbi:MAG TPA: alanine--tRNA ligase [Candidatus Babeliales bacterium]|nr:alanine--tRNA ligase [Candidatus Babeliales bacterium]